MDAVRGGNMVEAAEWKQEDVETFYSLLNGRRKMWKQCTAC
jgi:hypothetical protein